MIYLEENRSQIWFKVLQEDGRSIDGSDEQWSLPRANQKGAVVTFPNQVSREFLEGSWKPSTWLKEATWLVSNPSRCYQLNNGHRVFVAQLFEAPIHEESGMIWVQRTCLVREATNLDLRRFGIHRAFKQVIE